MFFFHKETQNPHSVTHLQELTSWHGIWYQSSKNVPEVLPQQKNPVISPFLTGNLSGTGQRAQKQDLHVFKGKKTPNYSVFQIV